MPDVKEATVNEGPAQNQDPPLWERERIEQRAAWWLFVILLIVSAVALVAMLLLWPENVGANSNPGSNKNTGSLPLSHLYIFALAGVLGAQVHALSSFALHMARRDFNRSWTWWYYSRPVVGMLLALGVVLAVGSGLSTTPNSNANNFLVAVAVSFIVGLFSEQATEKLAQLANAIFAPARQKQRAGEGVALQTAKRPVLEDVKPASVKRGNKQEKITASGKEFVVGRTNVVIDGQTRDATVKSPKSLEFTLAAGDLIKNGTLKVRALTTPPGGGISDEKPIAIKK